MAQARCMTWAFFSPYRVEEGGGSGSYGLAPNTKVSSCERHAVAIDAIWFHRIKLIRDRCGMHGCLHVQDLACRRI